MMRMWLGIPVVVLFATTAGGQTQTQTPFDCTRTSAVIGDGFTLDCEAADPTTSTTNPADLTIRNVRHYQSSLDVADWLYFDIVAGVEIERLELIVRFHYTDETFLNCSETIYDMSVNETSEGLVIPDNCGSDTEWSAVEIIAPAYVECAGCGVYQFSDLPVGRAIPAGAADSGLELERVLEDYQLQTQDRR